MALCTKHGQVYGEGCVCVKCAAEAKGSQPSTPKSNANVIPQKKG